MEFSLEQLRELITILDRTDIAELTLEAGEMRLNIRKSDKGSTVAPVVTPPAAVPVPAEAIAPSVAAPTTPVPAAELPAAKKLAEITSPMVGTFYRAPAPDESPFVEIGQVVRKGQVVCIIEAMKTMNEIEAEVAGRIVEIPVENAQPVEYGQVLVRLEPV